ncbi:MAG: sugar phosphate isomerase/epimerase [Roseiflexaceae bacterium]
MKIALQLWTVRDHTAHDMLGALRDVARIGYRAVEFAGLGTASAADVRRELDALQIEAISAHIALADLLARRSAVIEELRTLGCRQVVLPWIPAEQRTSLDQVERLAETCNGLGAALAAEDITFVYHNEDYDFLPLGDSTLWHTLVAHTDPALIALQLDLFTAELMGVDPIRLMREYGSRITSLHVCDMLHRQYVPIGNGELPWPVIIATARATAVEWLIVEQDGSPQSLADAAASLIHLGRFISECGSLPLDI